MALYRLEDLYDAENGVLSDITRQFPTMVDVKRYIMGVWESDWFESEFPVALLRTPVVKSRSASATFSISAGNVIAIANNKHHRTAATCLHELAHFVTQTDDHGRYFQATMLTLVRNEMGFYAYTDLKNAYANLTPVEDS